MQAAFEYRGAAFQIDAENKNNNERQETPLEHGRPFEFSEKDSVAKSNEYEHSRQDERKDASSEIEKNKASAFFFGTEPTAVQRKRQE